MSHQWYSRPKFWQNKTYLKDKERIYQYNDKTFRQSRAHNQSFAYEVTVKAHSGRLGYRANKDMVCHAIWHIQTNELIHIYETVANKTFHERPKYVYVSIISVL